MASAYLKFRNSLWYVQYYMTVKLKGGSSPAFPYGPVCILRLDEHTSNAAAFRASPTIHAIIRTIANPATAQDQTKIKVMGASSALHSNAQNEPAVPNHAKAQLTPAGDEIQPTYPPTLAQCTHDSPPSRSSGWAQCVISRPQNYKIGCFMVAQEDVCVTKML